MDPKIYKECEEKIYKGIQNFGYYTFIDGEKYKDPCNNLNLYFPYLNSGYEFKPSVKVFEDEYKEAFFAKVLTLTKKE